MFHLLGTQTVLDRAPCPTVVCDDKGSHNLSLEVAKVPLRRSPGSIAALRASLGEGALTLLTLLTQRLTRLDTGVKVSGAHSKIYLIGSSLSPRLLWMP